MTYARSALSTVRGFLHRRRVMRCASCTASKTITICFKFDGIKFELEHNAAAIGFHSRSIPTLPINDNSCACVTFSSSIPRLLTMEPTIRRHQSTHNQMYNFLYFAFCFTLNSCCCYTHLLNMVITGTQSSTAK